MAEKARLELANQLWRRFSKAVAYQLAVLLLAEAAGVGPARRLKRLASNELGLPVPNTSVKDLEEAARIKRATLSGSRVQAESASQLPSLPWRRGQDSNLQGRLRNLTVFETAGPINVPTPPWSRRAESSRCFPRMKGTFCH